MTFKVQLAATAKADMRDVHERIAEHAPQAADAWFEQVSTQILSLAQFPERHPVALEAETLKRDLRQMIVGNYRVIYALDARRVVVVHVRHAARLPVGAKRDEEE